MSGRVWEFNDPCLTFQEAKRLASWLAQRSTGESSDAEEDFLEPNIAFRFISRDRDHCTIRVYFELESRPPWKKQDGSEDDWSNVYIELAVTNRELLQASESLISDLRQLPPRKGMVL